MYNVYLYTYMYIYYIHTYICLTASPVDGGHRGEGGRVAVRQQHDTGYEVL